MAVDDVPGLGSITSPIDQFRLNAQMEQLSREFIAAQQERSSGYPSWWDAVGYPDPDTLEFSDYWSRYQMKSVGRGIIKLLVDDTWQDNVSVIDESEDSEETGFERDMKVLLSGDTLRRQPLHRFSSLDTLATLGEYGTLVFGFNDGSDLSTPISGVGEDENPAFDPTGSDPSKVSFSGVMGAVGSYNSSFTGDVEDLSGALSKLMYLTPYSEASVVDIDTVDDSTSRRHRLPEAYHIDTSGDVDNDGHSDAHEPTIDDEGVEEIHWSRVLHLPEGATEGDLYGEPYLRSFWHELLNIDKIIAGSSEGYWRAGYTGYVIRPPTDENGVPIGGVDTDGPGSGEVKSQMFDYSQNFDRNIATRGTVESLNQTLPSPMDHLEVNFRSISSATKIPQSILMGNERGDMATREDRRKYYELVGGRRRRYAEALLFRPFINRLIVTGVVRSPEGNGFRVDFASLDEPTEQQRAETASTWTGAYSTVGGGDPRTLFTEDELRDAVDHDPLGEDEKTAAEELQAKAAAQQPSPQDTSPNPQEQAQSGDDVGGDGNVDIVGTDGGGSGGQSASDPSFPDVSAALEGAGLNPDAARNLVRESTPAGASGEINLNAGVDTGLNAVLNTLLRVDPENVARDFRHPANGMRPITLNWNPKFHPRSPLTGRFIERPWKIAAEFADIESLTIGELLDESSFNRNIRRSAAWRAASVASGDVPPLSEMDIGDMFRVGPKVAGDLRDAGFASIEDVVRDPEGARDVSGMGRIVLQESGLPTTRDESRDLYPDLFDGGDDSTGTPSSSVIESSMLSDDAQQAALDVFGERIGLSDVEDQVWEAMDSTEEETFPRLSDDVANRGIDDVVVEATVAALEADGIDYGNDDGGEGGDGGIDESASEAEQLRHMFDDIDDNTTSDIDSAVDEFVGNVRRWKMNGYTNEGATIEQQLKDALDLSGDVRNGELEADSSDQVSRYLAGVAQAISAAFVDINTGSDKQTFYRGLQEPATKSLLFDVLENPDRDSFDISENPVANYSMMHQVSANFAYAGTVVRREESPDNVVLSPDSLFGGGTFYENGTEGEFWFSGGDQRISTDRIYTGVNPAALTDDVPENSGRPISEVLVDGITSPAALSWLATQMYLMPDESALSDSQLATLREVADAVADTDAVEGIPEYRLSNFKAALADYVGDEMFKNNARRRMTNFNYMVWGVPQRFNWNPTFHPRSPLTGRFIERPWNIPDSFADIEGDTIGDLLEKSNLNRDIRRSPVRRGVGS